MQETASAVGQLGDGIQDLLRTEMERYEATGKAGKKEAERLWKTSQSLALAQTIAAGAVAVMQALAQLGPIAGPIAAAGIVASTLASELATLNALAPEFDVGGIRTRGQSDQYMTTLYDGEGVLTRRGVDAIGGEGAVHAANKGAPASGGPMSVMINFRDRTLDKMLTKLVKAGGQFASDISNTSNKGYAVIYG
jgi:hypothetical protein